MRTLLTLRMSGKITITASTCIDKVNYIGNEAVPAYESLSRFWFVDYARIRLTFRGSKRRKVSPFRTTFLRISDSETVTESPFLSLNFPCLGIPSESTQNSSDLYVAGTFGVNSMCHALTLSAIVCSPSQEIRKSVLIWSLDIQSM